MNKVIAAKFIKSFIKPLSNVIYWAWYVKDKVALRKTITTNKISCISYQFLDRSFIDLISNLMSKRWNFDPKIDNWCKEFYL